MIGILAMTALLLLITIRAWISGRKKAWDTFRHALEIII